MKKPNNLPLLFYIMQIHNMLSMITTHSITLFIWIHQEISSQIDDIWIPNNLITQFTTLLLKDAEFITNSDHKILNTK